MMCDYGPVRARTPSRRGAAELPAKGSPARAVLRALCEEHWELGACYSEALWRDTDASGLVTMRFRILPHGRLSELCFLDTAIDDKEVLECVRERFLRLDYPTFDQKMTVALPIDFRPKAEPSTPGALWRTCAELRRDDAGS